MALLSYKGVGITAMAAALPQRIVRNYEYTEFFPEEQVREVVDKVGVFERRFADNKTCSSDLCYAAAERLLNDNQVNREEIDLLVFISQTPDYRMPATSITLQHRLGLPNSCIAFDINLGCSAFMYGLSVVYGMMSGHKKTGEDVIDILTYGIRQGSSLIIVYILAIQLYASLRFVFMF